MTVLQMRDTDEETNQPPAKKVRISSSRYKEENSRRSVEAWLNNANNNRFINDCQMPVGPGSTMVNGYGSNDPFHQTHNQRLPEENGYGDSINPIAPLLNLGNTCFLNSVLYTLRFAPSFLHKLHHLYTDSISFSKQLNAAKNDRACSLGRNPGKSGSWGNKEAFSTTNDSDIKTQALISKLHNVYASLWSNEYKDRMDPIQPLNFLHALRDVNPIFEGNHQHDAHELLVCLLDTIREACEIVYQQNSILERQPSQYPSSSAGSGIKSYVRKSLKLSRVMNYDKGSNCLRENYSDSDMRKYMINDDVAKDDSDMEERYDGSNQDTIFEDFQGVSLLRTKCLECETVTERKETFCDICVPIKSESDCDDEESMNRLYQSVIVTEEYLIGCNKYLCEKCARYNEAKRCVRYERLPRLLTLHLKRFSSGFGSSVSKVNDYMPTPFTLSCFCEKCQEAKLGEEEPPHKYYLYAVIMHLGATLASGHYVAYVRTFDNPQDYLYCIKDKPKTSSLSRGYSINSVSQNITAANSNSMHEKSNSIIKYFRKLSSKSFSNGSNTSGSPKDPDLRRERVKPTCKGIDCCSIRLRAISNDQDNTVWLECDDETIRTITTEDLKEMLAPKPSTNSALTPYLLFYTKA